MQRIWDILDSNKLLLFLMTTPITFREGLDLSVETYPKDNVTDPKAYLEAIQAFLPGDAVTIFTPDDTHFEIALAAIQRGG